MEVKQINPNGVAALAKDVQYLTEFVDTLGNPILRENLDELQQTVMLMHAENSDEFYDVSTRNKKYGRVDALNGPTLLEKYVFHNLETTFDGIKSTNNSTGSPIQYKVRRRPINSPHCLPGLA